MSDYVETVNAQGFATVRASDEDLHRAACKAFWESGHIVFESLPNLINQIIENKVWKVHGHSNFADYALDTTTRGLKINSNQRLWLLRCAMDVYGQHAEQWAQVLAKVETMVRVQAKEENIKIRHFNSNSLESLGKACHDHDTQEKITYLPSRSKNADRQLLKLRERDKTMVRRVARGELDFLEARRATKVKAPNVNDLNRTKNFIKRMSAEDRATLFEWCRDQGFLDGEGDA